MKRCILRSLPGRLMRILGPVILPATALLAALDPEIAGRGAIRPQVVGDHPIWNEAVFLQEFAHQFQRGMLASLGLDQHIEAFAFGVDGSPQRNHAASDFQIDFIQMPDSARPWAAFAQVCRDHRSKVVHPAADCLVGDCNPAFRQQILDVAEARVNRK